MGGIKDTRLYKRYRAWRKRRKFLKTHVPFLESCRGVIHIGAHRGQERFHYDSLDLDVLWIEGDPDIYEDLQRNLRDFPRQRAVCGLLSDTDGSDVPFHLGSNDGGASSMFEIIEENNIFDGVTLTGSKTLTTRTFERIASEEDIDPTLYDALVMDVQGAELLVLRGMGEALDGFEWLKLETSDFPFYEGASQVGDLLDYLEPRGFREVSREVFARKRGLGAYFDLILKKAA